MNTPNKPFDEILDERALLREEFIEMENNCPLCGSELKLNHISDYLALQITEEAHCPRCKIKTRAKDSTIH